MADLEHGVPITPQTVFYIGSVSKQFVTFSILLLEEAEKLSLDDDIRRYVPEVPQYEDTITIRHLIHHTSGIRDYLELWNLAGRDYLDYIPQQAVMDMIVRQKALNFPPGEKQLYSNSCYYLLSVIVERVSGRSQKEFAANTIFNRLGMYNTHFHDNLYHIIPNRAFGYQSNQEGGFDNLIMRFDLVGSGGIYATVEDLAKWDQNFYNNQLGRKQQSLIDTMQTDGILNNGESCGYAFALVNGKYRGLKTVSHTGALGGYRAVLTRFPEQSFSVIILSNLANFKTTARAHEVADIFLANRFKELKKPALPKDQSANSEEPNGSTFNTAQILPFTGNYFSDELNVFYKVLERNGQLLLKVGYNPEQVLEYKAENEWETPYASLKYQQQLDGRISGFILNGYRAKGITFTKLEE